MSEAYVVDTSVLIQPFIRDTETRRALTILARMRGDGDFTVNTFDFCLVECANVLWKRVRAGDVERDAAQRALTNLLGLPLRLNPTTEVLPAALTIALDSQLAVYDAVHIALAQKLKLPLITVDEQQKKTALAVGVILKPITDFPEFIAST